MDIKDSFVLPNFTYSLPHLNMRRAQHGFVICEDPTDKCPLESISKIEPYKFVDEREIIHIFSPFSSMYYPTRSCLWHFGIPSGYEFKIVFWDFDVSLATDLVIQNVTDILLTEKNVKLKEPHYFDGDWIQVYLRKRDPHFSTNFYFYVTVIKKVFKEHDDCKTVKDGSTIVWKFDDKKFKTNIRCTFDLLIRPNTEIIVDFKKSVLEYGADYITYNDENNIIKISNESRIGIFPIHPFYNDSTKQVSFEYVSNGSYYLSEFEIHFTEIECECPDPIFTCDNYNSIVKFVDHKEYSYSTSINSYYCSNMHCNFSIESCFAKNDYMFMRISGYSISPNPSQDIFNILSNDVIVANVNFSKERDFGDSSKKYFFEDLTAVLNSQNENIFVASTATTSYWKTITVMPFAAPPIDLKVVLSSTNPSYVIDSGKFRFVSFEIAESIELQNLSVIMYTTFNRNEIQILKNESSTLHAQGCYASEETCKNLGNKFMVLTYESKFSPFYAVRLSKNYGGCVFGETIYYVGGKGEINKDPDNGPEEYHVANLATIEDECDIVILIEYKAHYFISEMWTSAKTEDVLVFVGTNEKKKFYFGFNLFIIFCLLDLLIQRLKAMVSEGVGYPVSIRWTIEESVLRTRLREYLIRSKFVETSFGFKFYLEISPNPASKQISIFLQLLLENHQYYIDCEFIVTTKSSSSTFKHKNFGRGRTNIMQMFECSLTTFLDSSEYIVDGKFDMQMKGIFYIRESPPPPIERHSDEKESVFSPLFFIHEENLHTNWTTKMLGSAFWENEDKDFTIFVNTRPISVHKQILAIYSPVFAGMFKSGMKEAITNSMDIPNYRFEVVEIIVKLCYDLDIPGNEIMENKEQLFEFVDQYQMDKIKNDLEEFLVKKINFVTVCSLANCAILAKAAKLEDACFHLLMKCLKEGIAATDLETLNSEMQNKLFKNAFVTFV